MNVIAFSALDQAPTRAGTSPAQPIRDALELARHVDVLGYRRLWVAEHRWALASAAPDTLIGHVDGVTEHLRVGSGAVLLPNNRSLHSPSNS